MSNSRRGAACKSLRRRCAEDCVLAPYFPSINPHRFSCVHKIFGASNVAKMLKRLPMDQRLDAANSMSCEATIRVEDPVYGCVRIIHQLQQEIIRVQSEVAKIQGEIAYHAQASQHQNMDGVGINVDQGGASSFHESHALHLDQQPFEFLQ